MKYLSLSLPLQIPRSRFYGEVQLLSMHGLDADRPMRMQAPSFLALHLMIIGLASACC